MVNQSCLVIHIFEQKMLHFMIVSFEMVYLYQKHIVQHCSIHFIVVKMSTNDTCMMFAMCEGMPLWSVKMHTLQGCSYTSIYH
jgi:hypothetical protein